MRLKRKIGVVVMAAALAGGAASCGGGGEDDGSTAAAAPPGGPAVTIDTFIFEPDPLEVEAGTTVEFTNEDEILHTVTEGTREKPVRGGFDERLDGAGTTAEVTFADRGTVEYVCTIHAGMDGRVIVR